MNFSLAGANLDGDRYAIGMSWKLLENQYSLFPTTFCMELYFHNIFYLHLEDKMRDFLNYENNQS